MEPKHPLTPRAFTPKEAEDYGYDCGKNGPNTVNCSFMIFSTPELAEAWQRGRERADRERETGK